MTAVKIHRLESDDRGPSLIIRGLAEPAEILAAAQGELDDGEITTTPLEEIKVSWWRINPCREGFNCDDQHLGHYAQTGHQTRGGFQAAEVYLAWAEAEASR